MSATIHSINQPWSENPMYLLFAEMEFLASILPASMKVTPSNSYFQLSLFRGCFKSMPVSDSSWNKTFIVLGSSSSAIMVALETKPSC